MRNATNVMVSTFGALAGLAGLEHGIGETLQGNRAPDGMLIVSWPGSELFRIVGGEPAMTIVPNLLVTGILAILVSLVFLVWVTMFVQRKNGGLVLILLSLVMLLVGGGFGPPLLGIILGVAATRINAPFTWWRAHLSSGVRRVLGTLWPWSFVAGVIAWLLLFPGSSILAYFFGVNNPNLIPILFFFALGFLLLTIFTGFAYDSQRQTDVHQTPSMSGWRLTMDTLPVKRDLTLAYRVSLVIAVLMTVASVAGLAFGSAGLYGVAPRLVQVSRGGDAANLVVGLPILLGSLWLARRGSLIGLLLWPGALFYVLYTYALYLVGAPFNTLFLVYVGLVTLSAYTTIGIVASIDGEAVRQRLTSAPARIVGGALVSIAVLAYAALTSLVIATLASSSGVDPLLRPQWIVDYTVGTPVLLIGGVLLGQRARLGYVVAAGLLFLSGVNGVAFSVSAVLGALITAAPIEPVVIAVHLVISAISFVLLALFLHGAARRQRSARSPLNPTRPASPYTDADAGRRTAEPCIAMR